MKEEQNKDIWKIIAISAIILIVVLCVVAVFYKVKLTQQREISTTICTFSNAQSELIGRQTFFIEQISKQDLPDLKYINCTKLIVKKWYE